jgi:hypothetical protein
VDIVLARRGFLVHSGCRWIPPDGDDPGTGASRTAAGRQQPASGSARPASATGNCEQSAGAACTSITTAAGTEAAG